MRAAGEGVVDDRDIAGRERPQRVDHRPHARRHRPEVHGDMRRLREQLAVGVEQRTGKIAPFLDVRTERDALQRNAHLLGRGFEEIAEQFKLDGVGGHGYFPDSSVGFTTETRTARRFLSWDSSFHRRGAEVAEDKHGGVDLADGRSAQ
jgi:hypothetical protein